MEFWGLSGEMSLLGQVSTRIGKDKTRRFLDES